MGCLQRGGVGHADAHAVHGVVFDSLFTGAWRPDKPLFLAVRALLLIEKIHTFAFLKMWILVWSFSPDLGWGSRDHVVSSLAPCVLGGFVDDVGEFGGRSP